MKVRNGILFVLFVLLAGTPAFASEVSVAFTPTNAAPVIAAAQPPMSLAAGLEEVGRKYKEMWIQDQTGKKVRRACDFQCTQACTEIRDACGGGGECWLAWEICMCENDCCWGPHGNPYCS